MLHQFHAYVRCSMNIHVYICVHISMHTYIWLRPIKGITVYSMKTATILSWVTQVDPRLTNGSPKGAPRVPQW